MANKAPCKDCKERYVGCHGECVQYQDFSKKNTEKKELEYKERMFEKEIESDTYRRKIKAFKRDRVLGTRF